MGARGALTQRSIQELLVLEPVPVIHLQQCVWFRCSLSANLIGLSLEGLFAFCTCLGLAVPFDALRALHRLLLTSVPQFYYQRGIHVLRGVVFRVQPIIEVVGDLIFAENRFHRLDAVLPHQRTV